MRTQDILGAALLYLFVAFAYGVWTAFHDPNLVHASSALNPAFIRHCLTWPRVISGLMRASPIHRAMSSL